MFGKKIVLICLLLFVYTAVGAIVPISIRTYIDYMGTLQPEDIRDDLLQKAQQHIHTNPVTGALWVAVRFPANDQPVIMSFGNQAVDTIELFVHSDTGWHSAGLTGSSVPSYKKSIALRRSAIGIPAIAADKDSSREVLLRVTDADAIVLDIQVQERTQFFADMEKITIMQAMTAGLYCAIIVLLLAASFIYKDQILLLGAGVSVSLLFYKESLKGFGIYMQSGAVSAESIRYVCSAAAAYFAAVIITQIILQKNNHRCPAGLPRIYIAAAAIVLGGSFMLRSEYRFYAGFLGIAILFIAALLIYGITVSKHSRYIRVIAVCWSPVLVFVLVKLVFQTVRNKVACGIFQIFDHGLYFSYDIIFIFITAPFICSIINRSIAAKKQLIRLQSTIDSSGEQVKERLYAAYCLRRELMYALAVIKNCTDGYVPKEDNGVSQQTIHKNSEYIMQILSVCTFLERENKKGAVVYNTVPVKITEILKNALTYTKELALSRGNKILINRSLPDSLILRGNPKVIEYIFTLLLENAVKHSDRDTPVIIYLDYSDGTVVYTIRNTAEPVTAAEAEQLFQLMDADNNRNISLHLIRRLCMLSGGSAFITPSEHGNIFSATFALQECVPAGGFCAQQSTNSSEILCIQDKNDEEAPHDAQAILIATDNSLMSNHIGSIFAADCNIKQVSTGKEVLEFVKQYTPDLIICDRMLPVLSGYEVFKKLRNTPQMEVVPFILIGTDFSDEDKIRFLSEGIAACIDSFFNPSVFKAQISSFMEMSKKIRNRAFADIMTTVSKTMGQAADSPLPAGYYKDTLNAYGLSDREKEITALICSGKSDKEIAAELHISLGTVASHNKNIFKKLEIHSRFELINKLR